MDAIPAGLITGGGITGVLVLLVWAFVKGWIVVGSVVDRLVADKDSQITKLWEANTSLTESVRKYTVSAETSAHALHEIERRAAANGGSAPPLDRGGVDV